jgi:GNAT superfamily N-acetyltransferase
MAAHLTSIRPLDITWKTLFNSDRSDATRARVQDWLQEFNVMRNPVYMAKLNRSDAEERDLVITAVAGQELVGGLVGATRFSWLKINMLAVHPGFRLLGIGSRIVAEAERQALIRHCRYAYVDTVCFQSPEFYIRVGYRVMGEIPDWDSHGHTKIVLVKNLRAKDGTAALS